MEERQFLAEGDLLVTSTKIQLGSKTFATRNVGSVSIEENSFGFWAGFFVAVGVIALVGGAWIFAACMLAIGLIWGITRVREKTIVLMAGGGEVAAFTTSSWPQAERVRDAIASAISVR